MNSNDEKEINEKTLEELVESFLEQSQSKASLGVKEFIEKAPEQYKKQLQELLPLVVDLNDVASDSARKISTLEDTIPELPTTDFVITKKIGSGGMGTVYEGIQTSLNRKVAIKILSPRLITNATHRKSFETESQIIAKLHHPNIVKVLYAGSSIHCCYYVMELIDGKPLNKRCFSNLKKIAEIGVTLARALAYAHSCGIMHRDIKPTNILIDSNDNLHIGDFGLAYLLENQETASTDLPTTSSEDRSGTIRYMSPERLTKGTNSFVNDQYALGITLYELIKKEPVIEARSQKELINKISSHQIPPIVCDSPDLSAIINKSISFNPKDRYASMNEFADDLQRFLNHEPVKAHPSNIIKKLKLWYKRKPAIALLSTFLTTIFIALISSCVIGYYHTAKALERAEKSVSVADTTLSHIFEHISKLPPREKNTELLSTLIPYYQIIVNQENLSPEKLYDANLILAKTAIRVGKYELAEKAYEELLLVDKKSPHLINQLAEAYAMQNKMHDAQELWRQVVNDYSNSTTESELCEVVNALLSLSEDPNSKERNQAFEIIQELLKKNKNNPEYLFQYAQLLIGDPKLTEQYQIDGKKPNPQQILFDLANQYPDNREYGIALLKFQEGQHYPIGFGEKRRRKGVNLHNQISKRNSMQSRARAKTSNDFYDLSERMLWLWPNDPEVINAVINFQKKAIEANETKHGSKSLFYSVRLIHLLEMLYYNPETSTETKEMLISLQLEQINKYTIERPQDKFIIQLQHNLIERELRLYNGSRKSEFEQKLNNF
ncbi:MAG: protein kinase [Kiritimatiellae bacterium]|nr:protein kinase [Kiritimatiellia bacterium]